MLYTYNIRRIYVCVVIKNYDLVLIIIIVIVVVYVAMQMIRNVFGKGMNENEVRAVRAVRASVIFAIRLHKLVQISYCIPIKIN